MTEEVKPEHAEKNKGFFLDMKRLLSFELPWSDRTVLEKAYTALFIAILIGLFPMPYGFYDSLRVAVCIALYFFFQALLPDRKAQRGWFALIIGLFILYNPVVPIRIGEKAVWMLINAATLYGLFRLRLALEGDKEPPESKKLAE